MYNTIVTPEEFNSFFPEFISIAEKLNVNIIPWAIFAGSEVWLLTNSRKPTDLDILLSSDGLMRASEIFNQRIQTKGNDIMSADYILIENIELVSNISIHKDGATKYFELKDDLLKNVVEIDFKPKLKLLPVEETIIIKKLLSRGSDQGKHDLDDIRELISRVDIDEDYLIRRCKEHQLNYENILKT